jgi:prevent-host-death family protein
MHWQMQTAKQKLSELVDEAISSRPQFISRHGRDVAVVMSIDEYRRLTADDGFKAFLMSGPCFDDLPLERSPDLPREIDFP